MSISFPLGFAQVSPIFLVEFKLLALCFVQLKLLLRFFLMSLKLLLLCLVFLNPSPLATSYKDSFPLVQLKLFPFCLGSFKFLLLNLVLIMTNSIQVLQPYPGYSSFALSVCSCSSPPLLYAFHKGSSRFVLTKPRFSPLYLVPFKLFSLLSDPQYAWFHLSSSSSTWLKFLLFFLFLLELLAFCHIPQGFIPLS